MILRRGNIQDICFRALIKKYFVSKSDIAFQLSKKSYKITDRIVISEEMLKIQILRDIFQDQRRFSLFIQPSSNFSGLPVTITRSRDDFGSRQHSGFCFSAFVENIIILKETLISVYHLL
jgi:hypothetical protein